MNRHLRFVLASVGGALLFASAPLHADDVLLGATLPALLSYAREHNPDLSASRLDAVAARERIEPAGALPDPKFLLELMDATNERLGGGASLIPGQVGQTRYRVVQPIPFLGKRGMRASLAESQAGQIGAAVGVVELQVEAQIKTAFGRYYQGAGQTQILGETLTLVEALERLVATRYSVGLVPQQDVIQAQGEITSLKVDLVEADRRRQDAAAKLNAQLPRAADAPLAMPETLPPMPNALALKPLFEQAKAQSPELARERLGVDAAGTGRELVYLNRYPDFAVGVTNNRPRNGTDTWDVMIELNIPLQQSSRRAQEREAERRVEAARSRVEATEARINGRLGAALAAFSANADKARLLRHTLLPQARATFDSAQAGYESGRVNFNTLIEAERRILRTRLALLDAEVETFVNLTEIEQLVGEEL